MVATPLLSPVPAVHGYEAANELLNFFQPRLTVLRAPPRVAKSSVPPPADTADSAAPAYARHGQGLPLFPFQLNISRFPRESTQVIT